MDVLYRLRILQYPAQNIIRFYASTNDITMNMKEVKWSQKLFLRSLAYILGNKCSITNVVSMYVYA